MLKDDYSAVFGKHCFKVGVLASINTKNEDSIGNGSVRDSAVLGRRPASTAAARTTGNILADFLLRDMTFGFSESCVAAPGAAALVGPRGLRRRLLEDVARG